MMRFLVCGLIALGLAGCGSKSSLSSVNSGSQSSFDSKTQAFCKEARSVLDNWKEGEDGRMTKLDDALKAIPKPETDSQSKLKEQVDDAHKMIKGWTEAKVHLAETPRDKPLYTSWKDLIMKQRMEANRLLREIEKSAK